MMQPDEIRRFTAEFADALNRRDRDAWIDSFHPDFEGYSGLVASEGGEAYRGPEGAGKWFDNLIEVYERVHATVEQSIVVGDRALHLIRIEYVGKGSGLALEVLLGWVTVMRDGRYGYVHSHFDLAEAFAEMTRHVAARESGARAPLDAIRAVYARWSEGDFRAAADLLDPNVLLVVNEGFPDAGTYVGPEAVASYTRAAMLDTWTELRLAAEEVISSGDSVLVSVHQHGMGSTSGVPSEMRYFTLWSFRGGKVIRIESFRDRSDARAAAGL